jgi:hypothetical protein
MSFFTLTYFPHLAQCALEGVKLDSAGSVGPSSC